MDRRLPEPGPLADRWALDPSVVFLNHGSFGAAPRVVLEEQARLRAALEADPVRFFEDRYEPLLEASRRALAEFVGARHENLVFVPNATTGVNTVLRSLRLDPGDELVTTDHAYNACRNALDAVAADTGAAVRVVHIPFPCASPDEIVERVVAELGGRTRLLLVDHVTSPTALVLPLDVLVGEAQGCGVDVLVDGAHAPGMVDLGLEALGAAYYTGNCHKWLCAPKGAGFLHVREDRHDSVRPLVISHGANAEARESSRFHLEHDWTGTHDPTAWLTVPAALGEMASMVAGGWREVRASNHDLVVAMRDLLCQRLDLPMPCPVDMNGSMVALPIADLRDSEWDWRGRSPIQARLFEEYRIEVPVIRWPSSSATLVRVSAQLYNSLEQAEYLAEAVATVLGRAR
jgi:isopenicillin-N epimerase